jgi:hypothetical protein
MCGASNTTVGVFTPFKHNTAALRAEQKLRLELSLKTVQKREMQNLTWQNLYYIASHTCCVSVAKNATLRRGSDVFKTTSETLHQTGAVPHIELSHFSQRSTPPAWLSKLETIKPLDIDGQGCAVNLDRR